MCFQSGQAIAWHFDYQHNDIRHNHIQHFDTQHYSFSTTINKMKLLIEYCLCWVLFMLSVVYAECHWCWVSFMLSDIYAEHHLCWVSFKLSVIYAEWHLCQVSLMLGLANMYLMLSDITLNVITLNATPSIVGQQTFNRASSIGTEVEHSTVYYEI